MLLGQEFGWAFVVHVDASCMDAVTRAVPLTEGQSSAAPDWQIERDADGGVTLRFQNQVLGCFASPELAARRLEGHVALQAAARSPDFTAVHSGVVAVDGRGVLLPGRSRAGKTTLVASLIDAGAEYLSDEYALLDERGLVHPYPRDLGIRQGMVSVATPVASLGGRAAAGPVPIFVIAALTHADGGWSTTHRTVGESILDMMDNALAAQVRPKAVLAALSTTAQAAPIRLRGTRGDAAEAARRLLDLVR